MNELKFTIFDDKKIKLLGSSLEECCPEFDKKKFLKSILNDEWQGLELKQRVRKLSTQMGLFLPRDYKKAVEILYKVAPKFDGFFGVIFPDFVEIYGQDITNQEMSLAALKEFTRYSTSEFAIRPFIKRDPKGMLNMLLDWAQDSNEHVRRLSSEGARPRLPWGTQLPEFIRDPSPLFPILEKLLQDESEYVRKSVGNNLNDISKDHPDLVLKKVEQWHGKNTTTDKMLKKGMRTLLKKGNEKALKIFGLNSKNFKVGQINVLDKVKIGSRLSFSFKVSIYESTEFRVEYALYFLRKDGTYHRKVFRISEKKWSEGKLDVAKSHNFKKITTRTYYPGVHYISIVVNGIESPKKKFELIK